VLQAILLKILPKLLQQNTFHLTVAMLRKRVHGLRNQPAHLLPPHLHFVARHMNNPVTPMVPVLLPLIATDLNDQNHVPDLQPPLSIPMLHHQKQKTKENVHFFKILPKLEYILMITIKLKSKLVAAVL
jgi:hypothetical protein